MKILFLRKFQFFIFIFLTLSIIALGHQKRSVAYWIVPDSGILDELSYTWQGLSIRQVGIPIGWSDSGVYHGGDINKRGMIGGIKDFYIQQNDKEINITNISKAVRPYYAILDFDISKQTKSRDVIGIKQIDLVAPFFDHPPLGGLIFSLGVTPETKTFSEVTTFQTRKVSLYLAIITSLLLFMLTLILTKNSFVSFLGVSIYNLAPSYFFASRFALLENILAPFALLHLILLFLSFNNPTKRLKLLGLAGFVGGLLSLVKESGLGFVIGSLILMKLEKLSKKDFLVFFKFFAIPVVLYLIWGMYLSADVFFKVLIFNSSRQFWGSLNFLTMLTSLRFRDFPFDGWWIFGFISILILVLRKTKASTGWIIPVITHLILILFLGGSNYSWYYLALVPFLALASALVLWQLFVFPNIAELITFFIIPVSSSLFWGRAITQFTPNLVEYRLFLFTTFMFGFSANLLNSKKAILVWRIFFALTILILLILNYKSLTYIMSHWGISDYPSLPPT